MASVRLIHLVAAAVFLVLSVADPNSVCYSYGVDFVDEGDYFINNSNESFTCVSTFQGCNKGPDPAEILFVDPNNEEYLCSEVQTTPADTPMLSTCPFTKNEMISGHNMILVIGNNDDGEPFAWQRGQYTISQDKPCWYSPTLVHPAALGAPTASPNQHRYMRKSDRAVSVAYARARIEAAKVRRDQKTKAAQFDKRAPDAPTITVNATIPVNATSTITGSPITTTESTAISTTATITLPPLTVYSGRYTPVTTLPTPTKTRLSFAHTTTTTTKTVRATFTKTILVTPAASLKGCRKQGGHYWDGRG
ncbi:hypothetical protein P171DRAFT_461869 [Karstenula rhodostoma CBS 690.94]|uniref:Uncharacterized protein n=1 Tax=Karstenula rhodostoma CBS 690.94 TaxID=1392251 RepID=A0A9P4PNX6_9PLEO|nr:hypothetical protein P171DRAFT_461869 [Karstenula rhodostoma CBS 690.94]